MGQTSATLVMESRAPLQVCAKGDTDVMFGYRLEEGGRVVNGAYCRWKFENGQLDLENDQYGLYPVFYSTWGGRLVLSTDIPEILRAGVPADFDFDALSAFLCIGFHVGGDTPFRHIRRLPPNAKVIHENGEFRIDGNRPRDPEAFSGTIEDAIPQHVELFRRAMERVLSHAARFQMPLSGGRDSRHIFLEAMHQGHRPERVLTTRFLPPRDDNDIEVVAQLLEGTGVPWILVEPYRSVLDAVERQNPMVNYLSVESLWALALRDRLTESGIPVLDGLAGDVLAGGLYQTAELENTYAERGAEAFAEKLFDDWCGRFGTSDWWLGQFLRPELRRETSAERAVARIKSWVQEEGDVRYPARHFTFWNRTRNGPGLYSLGILRDCKVRFPFLDHDLFNFLQGLPLEIIAEKRLNSMAIREAYPARAGVAYSVNRRSAKAIPFSHLGDMTKLLARMCLPSRPLPVKRSVVAKTALRHAATAEAVQAIWWKPQFVRFMIDLNDMASQL